MHNLGKLTALCEQNGAQIARAEPMSAHTTFHIGGPCLALITLPDITACQNIVAYLREQSIPFRLIGRGSNLLVPDTGYTGVVLKLGGKFADPPKMQDDCIVCGAGASLKNLCLAALNAARTGLEFAYGIPGSVGGAVYMNAGAYGGEISQVIVSAEILDETGCIRTLPREALDLRYRHSIFMERDWIILSASFRLTEGDPAIIRETMHDLLGRRQTKQPLEYPSAGSTFKRPEGSYASLLIDRCGLKGYRVGGAQVSSKHAGFVVNRGGATYADVMAVCAHVQETVRTQTGYTLELEPEILGD